MNLNFRHTTVEEKTSYHSCGMMSRLSSLIKISELHNTIIRALIAYTCTIRNRITSKCGPSPSPASFFLSHKNICTFEKKNTEIEKKIVDEEGESDSPDPFSVTPHACLTWQYTVCFKNDAEEIFSSVHRIGRKTDNVPRVVGNVNINISAIRVSAKSRTNLLIFYLCLYCNIFSHDRRSWKFGESLAWKLT